LDIDGIFVAKMDIKNRSEVESIERKESDDYIIVDLEKKCDCPTECICSVEVYKVRPYTYDFLRSLQPFYSVSCYTVLNKIRAEKIIIHIERVLNQPVLDLL
jgi:hypothetical protein